MDTPSKSRRESPGRNAPCPCGSGKKFKRCCEGKRLTTGTGRRRRLPWLILVVAVGLGAAAIAFFANGDDADPPPRAAIEQAPAPWEYDAANNQYWHPIHGHWHSGPPPAQADSAAPSGRTPAAWEYDAQTNRHWDPDHGHWHDGPPPPGAPGALRQTPSVNSPTSPPRGQTPPAPTPIPSTDDSP